MSVAAPPLTVTDPPRDNRSQRCRVNLADEAVIPDWVSDLATFRQWAQSAEYPTIGKFSFLRGEIWADVSMEQLFSHNQLKTKLTAALSTWVDQQALGYVFADGVRLTHPGVGLSTEPDLVFVSFDAVRTGRVRFVEGHSAGFIELEGTPDLVVEIISASSVRKDTETLRDLYAECGLPEYWLLDARQDSCRFDILQLRAGQYVATAATGIISPAIGKTIAIDHTTDPLGHPHYRVKLD